MEDLDVLPIVVIGIGLLLVWGGLTGESPVARVKQILTKGGTQSPPAETATPAVTTTTVYPSTYTIQRDYLA